MKLRWTITVLLLCVGGVIAAAQEGEKDNPEGLLLKDYQPESVYRVPRTQVDRARYPVIDMHSHDYVKSDEEVAGWVELMDQVGIEKAIIMTETTGEEFDRLYARYAGRYPDRFDVWCGFDYTGYDQPGFGEAAVRELERCVRVGARGVGELGDKGKGLFYSSPTKAWGMHLNDPRMDPLLEKCAELGLPINIHVAEPYWMYLPMDSHNDGLMNAYEWRLDNQPGILTHEELMGTLEGACERHPRTTFVACHFANCSYDLNRLGTMLDRFPNLYADIAARYAETATIPRFVGRFYEKYQDRLVYGTDMGFTPSMYRLTFRILESGDEHFYEHGQFGYHWALNGFELPDSVLRKVYRDNAHKIIASAGKR
jgi:predicted TIM-barrel fold metal-dependent hydrolase